MCVINGNVPDGTNMKTGENVTSDVLLHACGCLPDSWSKDDNPDEEPAGEGGEGEN